MFLYLFVGLCALFYLYASHKFQYWKRLGVFSPPIKFPFGHVSGVSRSIHMGERFRDLYFQYKAKKPFVGIYMLTTPTALVTDPELLRHLFIKDFEVFRDRGSFYNTDVDPLSGHLAALDGDPWKNMRNKLTPIFTSGRIKAMHPLLMEIAGRFDAHLFSLAEKAAEVDMHQTFSKFTIDVIGNMIFGLECNYINNPDSEFAKYGMKAVGITPMRFFKDRLFAISFPKLAKFLNFRISPPDVSAFFLSTVRKTIDYRMKNKVKRFDFLQLLMEIKDTGKLTGEEGDDEEIGKLTFEQMAAQMYAFFVAGFDTSAATSSFTAFQLALNPEIQEKARQEVLEVMERHGGTITYEALAELNYLEKVIYGEKELERMRRLWNLNNFVFAISEGLRQHPAIQVLRRMSNRPYKVPNTDLVLPTKSRFYIPVLGFHYDPEIYPNPEIFDPERFSKEEMAKRHPQAWMPFGDGPRNCIGLRFGMIQTKIGLATLLAKYKVIPSERTKLPLKFNPSSIIRNVKGGLYLRLEKL